MRPIHAELVEEAKRRDPTFAPRPFTAKALESLRRIPDDYRAFLLEVGRLAGPLKIGHPGDFDMSELPEDFLPFAEDADHVYAFGEPVDRARLAEDLLESADTKKGNLESDLEVGELDEEEVEARRDELAQLEQKTEELRGDYKVAIGIGTFDKHEGEVTRSKETFTDWLERMTAPPEEAPAIAPKKKKAAATGDLEAEITRALDLLDLLVATEKLEVDPSFDENACAKTLAKCLDDPERVAELLVDAPGVVELYATEHEIETALSRD